MPGLGVASQVTDDLASVSLLAIVYTIEYNGQVRFAWDERKNFINFRKHGIWFEEAQTTWADSASVEFFDPEHSELEDRFLRIGQSSGARLLLVVFCEKEGDTIRIISARKATAKERAQYEEGI
jgi:uncharacterized protein